MLRRTAKDGTAFARLAYGDAYGGRVHDDQPIDPFHGDPDDPAAQLDDDEVASSRWRPRSARRSSPTSPTSTVSGRCSSRAASAASSSTATTATSRTTSSGTCCAATCGTCSTTGVTRVHEPAFDPDPAEYVSWDYARGFSDGVLEASESASDS